MDEATAADGARAAAALGAAAETAIDLPRVSWRRSVVERRAHVVVAQHVARTDNHGGGCSRGFSPLCNCRYMRLGRRAKRKHGFCTNSNVCGLGSGREARAYAFCKR